MGCQPVEIRQYGSSSQKLGEGLGKSYVLGELAAGVLIGPYLLGAVALPGFPHGLIPLQEGFPVYGHIGGNMAFGNDHRAADVP